MHEITVLAVDDHEAGRYALARLLEQARFVVKQAGTGTECLRLLAEDAPDVVLLDINLPDMNGYEVCRRIKADPRTHDTPVIHVTASARTSQDHARSLEGGADGYVLEPYDPDVLIATIRAVLRAREAEKAAQESALQWQTTFDALGDGVALLDGAGRILRCNKAFCRLLGLPAAELLNRRTPDIWISMGAKNDRYPFLEALASGARETADVQVNGRFLHASCDLISQDSCTTGAVYQISDVTEKRRLEEQVRETQKLESIGVLAGGIAHDFNNLLTGILGNASLALTAMPPDSDLAQNLSEIVSSSERAAELTRQLLAYSGKGRYVLKAVDLSRLVHDMTELLHSSLSKKVDLELALARGLPAVEADVRQLQQVVLNLAVNASEAFGENPGVILIETGVRDGQVSLRISDNGPGMDDRTKSKIFDPFFTTKFLGRGLGLAAVSGIVRSHGGSIEVTTAPGEGSTFTVLFPPVASVGAPEKRLSAAQTSRVVLVVDDEDVVCRAARAALEVNGFEVLLARNGREGIEVMRDRPKEIGVVLLDMIMPVLSGAEVVAELAKLNPDARIVASSGYPLEEAMRRFPRNFITTFLQKPYTSRQLISTIESVLAKTSP